MGGSTSRRKGARWERAVVRDLAERGVTVRRNLDQVRDGGWDLTGRVRLLGRDHTLTVECKAGGPAVAIPAAWRQLTGGLLSQGWRLTGRWDDRRPVALLALLRNRDDSKGKKSSKVVMADRLTANRLGWDTAGGAPRAGHRLFDAALDGLPSSLRVPGMAGSTGQLVAVPWEAAWEWVK